MVCLADMASIDACRTQQTTPRQRPQKESTQRQLFGDSNSVRGGRRDDAELEHNDSDDGALANGDKSDDSEFDDHSDAESSDASESARTVPHIHRTSRKRKRMSSSTDSNRAAPLRCTRCGETFTTPRQQASHSALPHPFVCDIEGCRRCFADEKRAIHHVTTWHQVRDNERYACHTCDDLFLTRHDLELHHHATSASSTHKPRRVFICDVVPTCRQTYGKKDKLMHHKKRYHQPHNDKDDTHNDGVNGALQFGCDRCTKSYATRHERLLHRQEVHPEQLSEPKSPSFACEIQGCGKSYSKREHLTRHVRATHLAPSEKPFGCELCGVRFVYKHALTRHYVNCHSADAQKPYSCSVCLLAFKKKSLLQAHSFVHTGVWPFECSECGEKFLKKFQLVRHERCHATQKPSQTQVFLCDEEDCDELLFSTAEKSQHMLQAHGRGIKHEQQETLEPAESDSHRTTAKNHNQNQSQKNPTKRPSSADIGRKLQCLVCERVFERVQNLRSHLRTHFEAVDERKLHMCPMVGCGKSYTKKSNVMAHYNAVHDPVKSTRFKCPHAGCDGAFGYKTVLSNHIASVHERRSVQKEDEKGDDDDSVCDDDTGGTPPRKMKKQRRGHTAMDIFTRALGVMNPGGHSGVQVSVSEKLQNTVASEKELVLYQ